MKRDVAAAARDLLIFAAAVSLLSFSWRHNLLSALVLAGLFAGRAVYWREGGDLAIYAVGALLGPLTEMIAIRLGVWAYAAPTVFGIPFWLPFAWGLAMVLFVRIAQNLITEK